MEITALTVTQRYIYVTLSRATGRGYNQSHIYVCKIASIRINVTLFTLIRNKSIESNFTSMHTELALSKNVRLILFYSLITG